MPTNEPFELTQSRRVARVSEILDTATVPEATAIWQRAMREHIEQDDNSISFLKALEVACNIEQ